MEKTLAANGLTGTGAWAKATLNNSVLSLSPGADENQFGLASNGEFSGILSNIIAANFTPRIKEETVQTDTIGPAERETGAAINIAESRDAGVQATGTPAVSNRPQAPPEEPPTRSEDATLAKSDRSEVPGRPEAGDEKPLEPAKNGSSTEKPPETPAPAGDGGNAGVQGQTAYEDRPVGAVNDGAQKPPTEVDLQGKTGAIPAQVVLAEGLMDVVGGPETVVPAVMVEGPLQPAVLTAEPSVSPPGPVSILPEQVAAPDPVAELAARLHATRTPGLIPVVTGGPETATPMAVQPIEQPVIEIPIAPEPVGYPTAFVQVNAQEPVVIETAPEAPVEPFISAEYAFHAASVQAPAGADTVSMPVSSMPAGTTGIQVTAETVVPGPVGEPVAPTPLPAPAIETATAEPIVHAGAPEKEVTLPAPTLPVQSGAEGEKPMAVNPDTIVSVTPVETPELPERSLETAEQKAPVTNAAPQPSDLPTRTAADLAARVAEKTGVDAGRVAVESEPESVGTREVRQVEHPAKPFENPLSQSVGETKVATVVPVAAPAYLKAETTILKRVVTATSVETTGEERISSLAGARGPEGGNSNPFGFIDRLSEAEQAGRTAAAKSLTAPRSSDMVERVANAVKLTLSRNRKSVRIFLNPPHLGSMRITMKVDNGLMNGRIEASTEAARAILAGNLPQLKESLAEQGIKVQNFEINVSGQDASNAQEDFRGGSNRSLNDGSSSGDSTGFGASQAQETDEQQAIPHVNTYSLNGGTLDLVA